MDRGETIADALHAWSENSPDPEYFFGGGEKTVFSMMQDTCADGARIIREMAAELAALRTTGTGRAEAEEMRERCAAWHDRQAREAAELAIAFPPGSANRAFAFHRRDEHDQHAAAIRALPPQPEGGARGE